MKFLAPARISRTETDGELTSASLIYLMEADNGKQVEGRIRIHICEPHDMEHLMLMKNAIDTYYAGTHEQ